MGTKQDASDLVEVELLLEDEKDVNEYVYQPTVLVKILNPRKELVPAYKTEGAAAMDLAFNSEEALVMAPGVIYTLPTGVAMQIPRGYEGQLSARSSLGVRGMCIPNAPGKIDPDYRGEIKVIAVNVTQGHLVIEPYERIAQLAICPAFQAHLRHVKTLPPSLRGEGGFGSTGK